MNSKRATVHSCVGLFVQIQLSDMMEDNNNNNNNNNEVSVTKHQHANNHMRTIDIHYYHYFVLWLTSALSLANAKIDEVKLLSKFSLLNIDVNYINLDWHVKRMLKFINPCQPFLLLDSHLRIKGRFYCAPLSWWLLSLLFISLLRFWVVLHYQRVLSIT